MTQTNEDWRRIRALRSDPPGLASGEDRRKRVFQSALAQAEELWEAATVVGPASRPLPLYYALSQAGRAICAAMKTHEWKPRGHGLVSEEPPNAAPLNLPISVGDDSVGAFGFVAEATGSTTFEGKSTLAELWASLPGFPAAADAFAGVLIPLPVTPRAAQEADTIAALREAVAPTLARLVIPAGIEAEDFLRHYPTSRGFVVEERIDDGDLGALVTLSFPGPGGSRRPLAAVADVLHPKATWTSDYGLRPRIGDGDDEPPSQLLTLWALLYGLSMLARYHPDVWVRLLDRDRSRVAVTLEHGLEVALERVPALVASALRGSTAAAVQ